VQKGADRSGREKGEGDFARPIFRREKGGRRGSSFELYLKESDFSHKK